MASAFGKKEGDRAQPPGKGLYTTEPENDYFILKVPVLGILRQVSKGPP